MVFRPWMYGVFTVGYAVIGCLSYHKHDVSGMVLGVVGVLGCAWMTHVARKYYGKWW